MHRQTVSCSRRFKPEKAVVQKGTRQKQKTRKIDKKLTKLKIGKTDRNSKDNLKKNYKTNTNDVLPLRDDNDCCIDTDCFDIYSQILTLSCGD